ncbi:hypothetical protein CROQUDRAFT_106762 [Cronartium quercuum f. sp. fusiforme G11]|uniref:Uncharacterized protein n=1 Tax=Cronartium quercuum f. sp. fusiforme G11 TaxID=708437 RepID=A0A9P6NMT4_9BASI|nr:hypothetical protein CROQUDRAFT_106762 [Cronartium quercuum f. sp. fusiforme G11]
MAGEPPFRQGSPTSLQATGQSLRFSSSDSPNYISSFKTPAKKIADALNGLKKGHAAAVFQLRTGHYPLNSYLHRLKYWGCDVGGTHNRLMWNLLILRPTRHVPVGAAVVPRVDPVPGPQHQEVTDEIYTAEIVGYQRRKKVKAEKLRTNLYNANALLDDPAVFPLLTEFVLATGRFEYLCSYLPGPEPDPKR